MVSGADNQNSDNAALPSAGSKAFRVTLGAGFAILLLAAIGFIGYRFLTSQRILHVIDAPAKPLSKLECQVKVIDYWWKGVISRELHYNLEVSNLTDRPIKVTICLKMLDRNGDVKLSDSDVVSLTPKEMKKVEWYHPAAEYDKRDQYVRPEAEVLKVE